MDMANVRRDFFTEEVGVSRITAILYRISFVVKYIRLLGWGCHFRPFGCSPPMNFTEGFVLFTKEIERLR